MNIAFIPVRGGSKSIPLKNIREIAGHPLVYWTLKAASECKYIDEVFVTTDSDIISKTVNNFNIHKVTVVGRSAETASDTASTESAMLEFAEQHNFDNIVLIQATSPLLTGTDLNKGFELFNTEQTDSVLSVVRQKRFNWCIDSNNIAHPTNYDVFKRPRRQEFDGYLVENGAFYITSRAALLKTKNRVSGNIRACEMNESTYFEIDEPSDWIIIEHLLKRREQITPTFERSAKNIKLFLMDCDGVLTDGGMYYSETGDELKKFNTQDGFGLRLLKERGIKIGVITGENRELNTRRFNKLKIDYVRQGISNKLKVIQEICEAEGVSLENVLYIGDDLNDIETIKAVGIGCSVQNGRTEVKEAADYVSGFEGGKGAVRDITDKLIDNL